MQLTNVSPLEVRASEQTRTRVAPRSRALLSLSSLVLVSLLAACGSNQNPAPGEPGGDSQQGLNAEPKEDTKGSDEETSFTQEKLEKLYTDIREAASNLSCTQNADCGSLAIGAKACGGPTDYLVYSKSQVDEAKLSQLAEELTEYEKGYNKQHDIVSNCMMLMEKSVSCVQGTCQAGEPLHQ